MKYATEGFKMAKIKQFKAFTKMFGAYKKNWV